VDRESVETDGHCERRVGGVSADWNGGLNALLNDRHSILVECPIRARVVADEAGEPRIKLVIKPVTG
jgi:hypothetical protein